MRSIVGALCLLTFLDSANAQATDCVLVDGTMLTLKTPNTPEPFATEGPITAIDVEAKTVSAMGKIVTIPRTCNMPNPITEVPGPQVDLSFATTATGGDGTMAITAMTMAQLTDDSAVNAGTNVLFPGALRSILGTQRTNKLTLQDQGAQSTIEQTIRTNFIESLTAAEVGLNFATAEVGFYPDLLGGTFKSAGHTYVDPNTGTEYLIPDMLDGLVVELSENVCIGTVTAVDKASRSLAVNGLMIMMNPDPRFSVDLLGGAQGTTPITEELFFNGVEQALLDLANALTPDAIDSATATLNMAIGGYNVGENFLIAQSIESIIFDAAANPTLDAARFFFRDRQNRFQVLPSIDISAKINLATWRITLYDNLLPNAELITSLLVAAVDPLTGVATASYRSRDEIDTSRIGIITISASDSTTGELYERSWLRDDINENGLGVAEVLPQS